MNDERKATDRRERAQRPQRSEFSVSLRSFAASPHKLAGRGVQRTPQDGCLPSSCPHPVFVLPSSCPCPAFTLP